MDGLEEKFTRCPQCRSYSIASAPPKITSPIFSRFVKQYNHYHCRNCGHDFKYPVTEDNQFLSLAKPPDFKKAKKLLLFLLPVLALILFFVFSPGHENTPIDSPSVQAEETESAQLHPEDPAVNEPPITEPMQTAPDQSASQDELAQSSASPEERPQTEISDAGVDEIAGIIDLAGSNRFGVNWVENTEGLVITRLSAGPFLNAGIKIGDKITLLNDKAISNGSIVTYRNNLIAGNEIEGFITVDRDSKLLVFKLINSALQAPQEKAPQAVLLLPQSPLKIRSIAPLDESQSHRWAYKTISLTMTRQQNQRYFISGSGKTLSPWAVDNILFFSGKDIPGLKQTLSPETTIIPKDLYKEPLDISEYFPPQKPVEMTFSLVYLGIKWGNSDIFLYVR